MSDITIRTTFPKKLSKYMKENGKTRNDLVNDLGFKYTTIRDWEKGLTVPRMDRVEMLANYFHCTTADLLEEREQPTDQVNDGLSDGQRKLIEFVKTVPEDKLDMIYRVMRSIAEGD